jgi:hypothetical protein
MGVRESATIQPRRTVLRDHVVGSEQDSLNAGQLLVDSSMVHIILKTPNEFDECAQRAGESGQGDHVRRGECQVSSDKSIEREKKHEEQNHPTDI